MKNLKKMRIELINEEKEAFILIDECTKCIEEGNTDNFRSYEEGIKDALEWIYCGNPKPVIMEE